VQVCHLPGPPQVELDTGTAWRSGQFASLPLADIDAGLSELEYAMDQIGCDRGYRARARIPVPVAIRDVFSADELAQLRGFPEISRAELIRFFMLTPADAELVRSLRTSGTCSAAAQVFRES
jgi:hypothetical protein